LTFSESSRIFHIHADLVFSAVVESQAPKFWLSVTLVGYSIITPLASIQIWSSLPLLKVKSKILTLSDSSRIFHNHAFSIHPDLVFSAVVESQAPKFWLSVTLVGYSSIQT
jgi:hypothetical protein